MPVSLESQYPVGDGEVKLTVVVGDAQLGSSLVKLETKEIGRGDIANLAVGKGPKLTGKSLKVKTVVTDVNDKTNRTSVTYELKGGVQPAEFSLEGTVAEEGDSIIYRASFDFV